MRILLVEDDPMIGEAVCVALRDAAYAVDWVRDGASAGGTLEHGEHQAVLLDLGLPKRDGIEVLRRLRVAGNALPVIVITARDGVDDRVSGLDHGADDYLVKPFALAELEARLRALARRMPAWRPDEVVVDTLRLDPAARRAWRGDRALELTTTEFALLEFLARHAGEVLGRQRISEKVWDANYDPASNIIDVYVARLRRKVDGAGEVPLLHTVRGAGYVLDPDRQS